jgi:SnoaL-like domain
MEMIDGVFRAIDSKDPAAFAGFLSPQCRFIFGNLPAIVGRSKVQNFVASFFDSISNLSHTINDSWSIPDGFICHGQVTYTRHDGTTLTVPFANICHLDSLEICDYRIFADTSQL